MYLFLLVSVDIAMLVQFGFYLLLVLGKSLKQKAVVLQEFEKYSRSFWLQIFWSSKFLIKRAVLSIPEGWPNPFLSFIRKYFCSQQWNTGAKLSLYVILIVWHIRSFCFRTEKVRCFRSHQEPHAKTLLPDASFI